jgi:hypothetical protein
MQLLCLRVIFSGSRIIIIVSDIKNNSHILQKNPIILANSSSRTQEQSNVSVQKSKNILLNP